jgi:phosphoribosylanthranilate isomerase
VPVKLVKICGITRLEDAMAAVAAGADAVGFVFWPSSPRCVDPNHARAIVSALPPFVTSVGVFVDEAPEEVIRVADKVRLGAVQLHGSETPAYASELGLPVVKAVAIGAPGGNAASRAPGANDNAAPDIDAWPENVVLLLDVYDPIRRGGTGRTIDWTVAAEISRRRRVILAGGLTAGNVREAIAHVRPFGIDVSSGVETAPGIKDHERLKALFEAVYGNDYATRS